jgi:YHS domain-containing protein
MIVMFGFIAVVALVVVGCGGESVADEEKPQSVKIEVRKAQDHCPVMGNPVDRKVFFDYEGKRIYFCCSPCIEKFKEDPEGFIKKMEAEGIGFEKVAGTEDHDHAEHDHDHGEAHDLGEDHDHDKDHGDDHGGHGNHDHG